MSFFLGNKKRDLSDKSRAGEDSKNLKSLDALLKKIDELETEMKNKDEKIQLLENRVEILEEEEKESQGKEIDDLQQYSRRNCLLLHGVAETNAECTDNIIIKTCAKSLVLILSKKTLIGAMR